MTEEMEMMDAAYDFMRAYNSAEDAAARRAVMRDAAQQLDDADYDVFLALVGAH